MSRFTVEERADRWHRRYACPWVTSAQVIGPVEFSWRWRRYRRVEFVRLDFAMHDLRREFWLAMLPILRPFARWLSR